MYNANGLQPVSGSARATHMGSTDEDATECAGRCGGDMMNTSDNNATGNTLIGLPPCPLTWGTQGKHDKVACREGRHRIGPTRVQCKRHAARVGLQPCCTVWAARRKARRSVQAGGHLTRGAMEVCARKGRHQTRTLGRRHRYRASTRTENMSRYIWPF